MPRKEIDYSKTVIYKIVCNDLNVKDVYVGHTTDFHIKQFLIVLIIITTILKFIKQ